MGKPQSQTTESSSTTDTQRYAPSWLTAGQKNLVGSATAMTNPFLNIPSYMTAGFTPDQIAAFDLARTAAMNSFTTNPSTASTTPGAYSIPPSAMAPAQGTAAQLNPTDYKAFMNPYVQEVVNATMNNLNTARQRQSAEIGAKAAAAGAYGGSREAVQRALLNKNFTDTAAQTVAELMSRGYDQATATAMANTQLRQNMTLQNVSNQQQAAAQNAQLQQQAALQSAANALQVPQINAQSLSADQTRQLQALQMLLGTGGAQQALAQQNLNIPWTTLQLLNSILGPSLSSNTDFTQQQQQQGTSTTTGSGGTGGLQSILGLGSFLFGGCDRSLKTNIELLGEIAGVPIYMFDYIADVEAARAAGQPMGPKRVGIMAEDIEKFAPEHVVVIGDKKILTTEPIR